MRVTISDPGLPVAAGRFGRLPLAVAAQPAEPGPLAAARHQHPAAGGECGDLG